MEKEQKGHLNVPASELPKSSDIPTYFEPIEDFRESINWRIFRILSEFVEGWQFIADFEKTVSFFGSARFKEDNYWYKEAHQLATLLSKDGFTIVTGGGPGIMEAANRGAFESGGESVGLNIKLPNEQRINPYVHKSIAFHYFFVRKLMLSYASRAYIFFPGGFGTFDEAFEILTLIQTGKISEKIPVVLIGKEFWNPIHEWLSERMYKKMKTVDERDLAIYTLVDSAEEAYHIVKDSPPRQDAFY